MSMLFRSRLINNSILANRIIGARFSTSTIEVHFPPPTTKQPMDVTMITDPKYHPIGLSYNPETKVQTWKYFYNPYSLSHKGNTILGISIIGVSALITSGALDVLPPLTRNIIGCVRFIFGNDCFD